MACARLGRKVVSHAHPDGSRRIPYPSRRRSGTGAAPVYKYADKRNVNGPITAISLRDGKLRLRGRGAALYPLAGAPLGSATVRLELGAHFGFCATAPAKLPASSNDTTARFNGAKNTPAGAQCPPLP
jgi:hypothetical protein